MRRMAGIETAPVVSTLEITEPGGLVPDAARSAAVVEGCRANGLLIGKGGLYGNVLRIAPMLDVAPSEIDEALEALRSR